MSELGSFLAEALLGCALFAHAAFGQGYKPDDPIPPGAKGKVTAIQTHVVDIKGLSSSVSGKSESLKAAMVDLGAKSTPLEVRIELSSDVLFDFDKADLLPKAIPTLQKVATVLLSYPMSACVIEGHTDSLGNAEYNQKLSERRAESVKKWLTANGVSSPIGSRGLGKTHPVAPNTKPDGKDDPEGRRKNRRVEIVLRKTGAK